MATAISDVIFWLACAAIAIAQVKILTSTRRGMRVGRGRAGVVVEWSYAVLPAIALVFVLAWTWRTMHDGTVRFRSVAPSAETSS
jgi:hypothetical protein